MSRKLIGLVCLIILSLCLCQEHDQRLNKQWAKMHEQYTKQMQQKESLPVQQTLEEQRQTQQLTEYKNKIFEQIMQKSGVQQGTTQNPKFSSFLMVNRPIQDMDMPSKFFTDEAFTTNIHSIPMMANVTRTPWSGSYWPMRNGAVSVRYGKNEKNTIGIVDPESGVFTYLFNWAQSVSRYAQPDEHNTWSKSPEFAKYVDDNYSPSEKYDLLVGDYNYTLTNFLKNEGAQYQWGGDVIGWFGLCHGWAPASSYYPRPQRSVFLTAANGMQIRFLPDDIKGLASLFWANADYKTKFVGNRCEFYYPSPGWFSSPNCISLNAAAFITILGNQAGLRGKNLVFDPSADPEIWNEPLKGYEFRFYNPLNNEFFPNAASAKISMSQLRSSGDEFLNFVATNAAPAATSAVGVFMRVTYAGLVDITDLHHNDTTAEDSSTTDDYDAILELDASDNLVGGEWKFKSHPNFLWWYDESEPVKSVSDEDIPFFGGDGSSLSGFMDQITKASAKGQPLAAIVNLLTASAS